MGRQRGGVHERLQQELGRSFRGYGRQAEDPLPPHPIPSTSPPAATSGRGPERLLQLLRTLLVHTRLTFDSFLASTSSDLYIVCFLIENDIPESRASPPGHPDLQGCVAWSFPSARSKLHGLTK